MKRLKKNLYLIMFIFVISLTFGNCTTAMYGKTVSPHQSSNDLYELKVYVDGLAGSETAKKRADKEIQKYIAGKDYRSYEIVPQKYNLLPSSYQFIVRLKQ